MRFNGKFLKPVVVVVLLLSLTLTGCASKECKKCSGRALMDLYFETEFAEHNLFQENKKFSS